MAALFLYRFLTASISLEPLSRTILTIGRECGDHKTHAVCFFVFVCVCFSAKNRNRLSVKERFDAWKYARALLRVGSFGIKPIIESFSHRPRAFLSSFPFRPIGRTLSLFLELTVIFFFFSLYFAELKPFLTRRPNRPRLSTLATSPRSRNVEREKYPPRAQT